MSPRRSDRTLGVNEASSLELLLSSIAQVFDGEQRPGAALASAALRAVKVSSYKMLQIEENPRSLIEQACLQTNALPVSKIILDCCDLLSWKHWGKKSLRSDISRSLYFSELLGPDGNFSSNTVRVGLLISKPFTDYPVSSHSGEETYFVVSGTADWCVSGNEYIAKSPGTLVHHSAWTPHGRRTTQECFLGVWRWSGDLNLNSFTVVD